MESSKWASARDHAKVSAEALAKAARNAYCEGSAHGLAALLSSSASCLPASCPRPTIGRRSLLAPRSGSRPRSRPWTSRPDPARRRRSKPGDAVSCTYVHDKLGGKTPKFACKTDENDQLKVKFGGDNGEVYAEMLASRLLWALGFGADHMYSVRVVCRDCPVSLQRRDSKPERKRVRSGRRRAQDARRSVPAG